MQISERALDRLAMAHDASHYLLVPSAVATAASAEEVAQLLRTARHDGRHVTFRSGGTSLSGQAVTDGLLVDTRTRFRHIEVLDGGARVRAGPGTTLRQVNARLAPYGRKLGPDPASEVACTVGGIVANNSSGMACGVRDNAYNTLESMVLVLPSGTVLDTGAPDADRRLHQLEPRLHAGLLALTRRVRSNPEAVREIRRQFAMKNTMGYGLNAFLDFNNPVDVLAHLVVGSEGTLAFVASATFRTIEVLPCAATGLAVYPDLAAAMAALPALVDAGFATVELMDAASLKVTQQHVQTSGQLAALHVDNHAAFLVEHHAATVDELRHRVEAARRVWAKTAPAAPVELTSDARERADLWHIRKGLYAAVAGARPSGTTALLEDIVVPVPRLLDTCAGLVKLFDRHVYEASVIFGHAKDGNVHFMLNERFPDPAALDRYTAFTEDLVALVLDQGGNLKAEHGTGRMMAPYVRRQYGDELYDVMREVKRLCDPTNVLNPDVILSDDPAIFIKHLKSVATVDDEVDRCVECGYCEPTCPSRILTTTPRQRIVLRREMTAAEAAGDHELLAELRTAFDYEVVQTCAVDGLCEVACPVGINTGDLVRRLRAETAGATAHRAWDTAARHWEGVTSALGRGLNLAKALPAMVPSTATRAARRLLGAEIVPLYDAGLPAGGRRRRGCGTAHARAVFFPSCLNRMFGPTANEVGAMAAVRTLCARAGMPLTTPGEIGALCCGTPWKSKGYRRGYDTMTAQVLPVLWEASREGELPVVCDAASCAEGLVTMRDRVAATDPRYGQVRIVDAVAFVAEHVLDSLEVTQPLASLALHPTCSTARLGTDSAMATVAERIAGDVHIPVTWGCCGFAGDRGLLYPELTAAATADEADEVRSGAYAAYASANRTCELAMTRAVGREYVHLLELVEQATRPKHRG